MADARRSEIEAKEVRVGDLFSENFMFTVPIYQRPLSWNSDNFDQLFEDISDALSADHEQYFLGSILLRKLDRKNHYELVDGQQRLAALAILLAVIRDSTEDEDLKDKINNYWICQKEDRYKQIPAVMRITPWEDLRELFAKYIYRLDGTNAFVRDFDGGLVKYKDTQAPTYHLWEAISTFREKIVQLPDVVRFVTYLLNEVYMVYIKTPELTSAFRLFSVLNARGLPLSPCDLLKSENLGVIQDDREKEACAQIWRKVEDDLGRDELDNLIAYVRTIKTREKASLGMYEEFHKLFRSDALEMGGSFIRYIREMANIYEDKVLDGQISVVDLEKKNKYKILIDLMYRFIPFFDWIPPVMRFYHKFQSQTDLLSFVLLLEKKVVLEWAAGFTRAERVTSLNRVLKLIEENSGPVQVVNELLSYRGNGDGRGKESRFLNFADNRELVSTLKGVLDNTQFYSIFGGRFARYMLLRADMELWDLENFPGYPGTVTVEHVLPQTPAERSQWISTFSDEDRRVWTNRLGNLVLLSGRKNSNAQNFDFDKKKEIYFRKKSTPFRITQQLEHYPAWTIQTVAKRHEEIIKNIQRIFVG